MESRHYTKGYYDGQSKAAQQLFDSLYASCAPILWHLGQQEGRRQCQQLFLGLAKPSDFTMPLGNSVDSQAKGCQGDKKAEDF